MGGVVFTLCISQTQLASPMEAWARRAWQSGGAHSAWLWQCHPSLSHHHVHYRPLLHPRIPTLKLALEFQLCYRGKEKSMNQKLLSACRTF